MKCWSFKIIETVGLTTKTVSLSVIVPEVNRKNLSNGLLCVIVMHLEYWLMWKIPTLNVGSLLKNVYINITELFILEFLLWRGIKRYLRKKKRLNVMRSKYFYELLESVLSLISCRNHFVLIWYNFFEGCDYHQEKCSIYIIGLNDCWHFFRK